MENEKTLLEKIIEQKTKQITRAIEYAIECGSTFERSYEGVWCISGVVLQEPAYGQDCDAVLVLELQSDIIRETMEDTIEALEEQRDDLARQLEEVEQKLKNRKQ